MVEPRFRPWAFAFLYGLFLGLAFLTHVWVGTLFPVMGYALLRQELALSMMLLALFGLGRALPLWIPLVESKRRGWACSEDALDHVHARKSQVHPLNGIALAVVGSLLLTLGLRG